MPSLQVPACEATTRPDRLSNPTGRSSEILAMMFNGCFTTCFAPLNAMGESKSRIGVKAQLPPENGPARTHSDRFHLQTLVRHQKS